MKHAAWALLNGGWYMVGDPTILAEARLIRDDLRAHGVDAEVRLVPSRPNPHRKDN